MFCTAFERLVVTIEGAGLVITVKDCEEFMPLASVTCTVNVADPAVVGVPDIRPVEVLSDNPAGREPEVTVQLSGASPPTALTV